VFGVQQSQKAAATRERFFCHSKQNTKTVHLESLTLGGPYDGSMTMRALENMEKELRPMMCGKALKAVPWLKLRYQNLIYNAAAMMRREPTPSAENEDVFLDSAGASTCWFARQTPLVLPTQPRPQNRKN